LNILVPRLEVFPEPWIGISEALKESHVRVYELETVFWVVVREASWSPRVVAFACDLMQVGARLFGWLYFTAAALSHQIQLLECWKPLNL
jgi:hypothetical protein